MKLRIAVGTSSFREIREKGLYYIDKSQLVSELLATDEKVTLLPRPRRFGKTLSLSMLHCFFDHDQQSRSLFEGLAVSCEPASMAQLNAFPTIFLSFKDASSSSWENCKLRLREILGHTLLEHLTPEVQASLDSMERSILLPAMEMNASLESLSTALLLLTRILHRCSGKKVVLLIDEYDLLVHRGRAFGYYTEAIHFLRPFLTSVLKDNPCLERAVITGILRIAKESIFSDLNNLAVYSILDGRYATCFGFSEAEVHRILADADLADKEPGVKDWYNGYLFGIKHVIYNPWSILNYVNRSDEGFKPHWLGTSANDLAREMIQDGTGIDLTDLTELLNGHSVRKKLNINIGMRDIESASIWNVLLFTGYLTALSFDPASEVAELIIPNAEVRLFFEGTFSVWFGEKSSPDSLVAKLLGEQLDEFASGLPEVVRSILSFHDTATTPERVYHVFVVGMMAHLRDHYTLTSNREAGHGRADLMMVPRKPGGTGFIFEFKSGSKGKLSKLAGEALDQISDRDYAAVLREARVERLVAVGLAFRGKRIALATFNQDLTSGLRSATQTFSKGPTEFVEPAKPSSGPPDDLAQRAALAGQIQLVQRQRGIEQTAFDLLLNKDLVTLQAMATALGF